MTVEVAVHHHGEGWLIETDDGPMQQTEAKLVVKNVKKQQASMKILARPK
jgi:hypothetical protein